LALNLTKSKLLYYFEKSTSSTGTNNFADNKKTLQNKASNDIILT